MTSDNRLDEAMLKDNSQCNGALPIYLTPKKLAKYLGVGEDVIYRYLNKAVDPMPYLPEGRIKYVNRFEAIEYLKKYELGATV